jgi:dTDP-glucose 4,6-dehydratase
MRLLDWVRSLPHPQPHIIYFSTDEVFGPAADGVAYKEWDRYKSSNPYAASKAGGEELCIAYHNTYGTPVTVTHTMNVFGERQHPEKFIPMTIKKILAGEKVTIHSDKTRTISGSRMWIHARNVAAAILFLLQRLEGGWIFPGDKWNIVGEREVSNLEMAQYIALMLGKEINYEMVDFHSSRPGHDLRYALDGGKLAQHGYGFPKTFEESLSKTIRWYLENQKWLEVK